MNILEYIEELMDGGMSEENASICADCLYNDNWMDEPHDDEYYKEW